MSRAKFRNWVTRDAAGCYVESHHIIPRSIGGTDDSENLVFLTAKEHFVAHLLLAKIHRGTPAGVKMSRAIVMMMGMHKKMHVTSRLYAVLKEDHANELGPRMSALHKGVPKTADHAAKIGRSGDANGMWGRTTSDKQKEAVRIANTGKIVSIETRKKMRKASTGRRHTLETKALISKKKKGVPLSPEAAAKARIASLGKKKSPEQRLKTKKSRESYWEVIDPKGNSQIIVNLRQFCVDNDLDQGNMVGVSRGRLKTHKKWKCVRIDSVPKVA